MNLLREEFCKETNTPMGLDDVYNYVKWLEDKFQKERSYSEENLKVLIDYTRRWGSQSSDEYILKEWFNEFKKK